MGRAAFARAATERGVDFDDFDDFDDEDDDAEHDDARAMETETETETETSGVVTAFHDIVREYFRGALKPPFNDDARARAGFTPAWYLPLAEETSVAASRDEGTRE